MNHDMGQCRLSMEFKHKRLELFVERELGSRFMSHRSHGEGPLVVSEVVINQNVAVVLHHNQFFDIRPSNLDDRSARPLQKKTRGCSGGPDMSFF